MITVTTSQFQGTASELSARVQEFIDALAEHTLTVGVPAPREEDFIENIVRSGDKFELEAEPVEPDPVPQTPDQIKAALAGSVQNHLDVAARSRGYDSILSAVTYADEYSVKIFQKEGQAFRLWRSLVWEKCYAILAEVIAGTREIPGADALIAELPPLSF